MSANEQHARRIMILRMSEDAVSKANPVTDKEYIAARTRLINRYRKKLIQLGCVL